MFFHSSSPERSRNHHAGNTAADSPGHAVPTADEWFAGGSRVHFDPNHKKIAPECTPNTLQVFERVVKNDNNNNNISSEEEGLWLTCLPSFPDGSYGFAKMEQELIRNTSQDNDGNDKMISLPHRLYLDYVGQGDSEKPPEYPYSTLERANLVQALWTAHQVQTTVVVTVGYSSLVLMELLRRQQERDDELRTRQSTLSSSTPQPTLQFPRILHVLCINGILYADGHSVHRPHRHLQPLLQRHPRMGQWSASLAQRSNVVLDLLLRPYYGHFNKRPWRPLWRRNFGTPPASTQQPQNDEQPPSSPHTTAAPHFTEELRQMEAALRRRGGLLAFWDQPVFGSTLEQEHQVWAEKWDLSALVFEFTTPAGITWECVGVGDEVRQGPHWTLAEERLRGCKSVTMTRLPSGGGHLLTVAQAPWISQRIKALVSRARRRAGDDDSPSWSPWLHSDGLEPPATMIDSE